MGLKASAPSSGSGLLPVGNYHGIIDSYEVDSFTDDKTKEEHFGLKCEVSILGAEDEHCVGKVLHYQSFYFDRLYSLAAAIGLTNLKTGIPFDHTQHEQLREAAKAKQSLPEYEFDETEATGRQFCFNVVMGKPKKSGKNAGESFPEIGKIILSPSHPDAANFPRDMQMLGGEGDAAEPVISGGKFD